MSTASPQERDLAIGRHAVMAEAFELLANHLGPFIDERMAEYFVDEPSWSEAAANRLGRPNEHGATDPLFQLLVLRRFWGPVFADFYGEDLRKIIGQLIDTRNMWAHFSFPEDPSALQRSVLAIERLLAPVEPETAARLRHLRSRVDNPDFRTTDRPDTAPDRTAVDHTALDRSGVDAGDETTPDNAAAGAETEGTRNPPTGDSTAGSTNTRPEPEEDERSEDEDAWPQRPDVDVATLLAQLIETESVFHELQDEFGTLQQELNHTRRLTANKQLKLSVMEQRLVEVEDHSLSMLEDLMEERVTRQHIEWLIVGLLATLLLFMVLAST